MFKQLFLFTALTVMHTFSYSNQVTQNNLKLVVNNLRVNALIVGSADVLQFNTAVGGYANDRLSINNEFKSKQEFLDFIANTLDARVTKMQDVIVFSNKCIGNPINNFNPFNGIEISFHFSEMKPSDILEMLYRLSSHSKNGEINFPTKDFGLVGMHLNSVDMHLIYDMLSAASGVFVTNDSSGKLTVLQTSNCVNTRNDSNDASRSNVNRSDCPRTLNAIPTAKKNNCGSLEYYKIENIVLRGYLQIDGKYFAFAETPDGLNWIISTGNFLGHDFGMVVDVNDKGISIAEVQQNPYGFWYQQKIFVDYQNNRRPILEN